jgi:hypothetical protein
MKRYSTIIIFISILLIVGLFVGYASWNSSHPQNTCARCHEINPSFHSWQASAHRNITCTGCHGTALSNGMHSLKEKGNMVLSHLTGKSAGSQIRLSEEQLMETMQNCIRCHQTEYSKWLSGGHSATYSRIFLNEAYNSIEQPYWDCFRCHGMFYEGTIYDLVEPVSMQGPWKLKDPSLAERPVMPCFACHQIHSDNDPISLTHDREQRENATRERMNQTLARNSSASLYVRADGIYLRANHLPAITMNDGGKPLTSSANPGQRLCIQCHAPNFRHISGSEDDRTPRGVHEGISCTSCHELHSNNASRSCVNCHPAFSNCGLDVTLMNTSFADPASKNNIHFVACKDCHM